MSSSSKGEVYFKENIPRVGDVVRVVPVDDNSGALEVLEVAVFSRFIGVGYVFLSLGKVEEGNQERIFSHLNDNFWEEECSGEVFSIKVFSREGLVQE